MCVVALFKYSPAVPTHLLEGETVREWRRKWQERGGGRGSGAEAARITRTIQPLAALIRSSPTSANYSMRIPPPITHAV